jgi:hypothetical protein
MSFVPAQNVGSNGNPDVAFLVFQPMRQRRADNSFDGNDNIGAKVIADTLERNNVSVGYCSPESAHQYRVVLVSLTSTYDVFAFYQAVAMLPSWQLGKRCFRVLCGGFGMQNPTTIRQYIDYAAFGRAEHWVVPVVEALRNNEEPQEHPSLMALPDMHHVEIAQAPQLYDREIEGWKETFTGCPLKCKFCHYTWARKHQGTDEAYSSRSYVQSTLTGGGTPELTWDQLFTYGKKAGRIRVAIDGFSERTRYIYGKRISNDDIVNGVSAIGQYGPNATTLLVYNISNMPHETQDDREDLYTTLRQCDPKHRVIFVLHSTPFRPSIATPMQWEPVTLFPDWSKLRAQEIVEKANFRAVHSFTLETPWSHLCSVVAERATPAADKLFHALAFAPGLQKGKHADRLRAVQKNFDISPYIREYDIEEEHPAWFLQGYIDLPTIRKIARKMRETMGYALENSGWLPGNSSIVAGRLRKKVEQG